MIEKARPHGWIDDSRKAIKAHVEWVGAVKSSLQAKRSHPDPPGWTASSFTSLVIRKPKSRIAAAADSR